MIFKMLNPQIYALTLNYPSSVKTLRAASQLLHKWRFYCSSVGTISFAGTILFQARDTFGKPSLHAHLCLMTTIPEKRIHELANNWTKITKLSLSSVDIDLVRDLAKFINYTFFINVEKSDNYKMVYYRQEFLKEIFKLMEEIHNGKKISY
jgi:hypothetical protein